MFWIILLAIIAFFVYLFTRSVENHQRWAMSFDNLKFSSQEFYELAEEAVKKREIPEIEFSRVTYSEGGMFSANREYLHIRREEYIYDICAAPFGTGFFISQWMVEKPDLIKKLLRQIKSLAPLAERRTYYQIDTASMFKGAVHAGVLEAIDAMTSNKGYRSLSEIERRFPDPSK